MPDGIGTGNAAFQQFAGAGVLLRAKWLGQVFEQQLFVQFTAWVLRAGEVGVEQKGFSAKNPVGDGD